MIIDCHTHNPEAKNAIVSVEPLKYFDFTSTHPNTLVSVGIHPWSTDKPVDTDILDDIIVRNNVVLVGECGLDSLKGAPIDVQQHVFEQQISLSERIEKPMIIHCVKSWDRLLAIHRDMNVQQQWIIHGFRGKPQLATQLLDRGCFLSFGERYNDATVRYIPSNRILVETDESQLPIEEIISRIEKTRGDRINPAFNLKNLIQQALK